MTTPSFDDIPLIDDHAHPMLSPQAVAREPFTRSFTVAHDPETIARHAPHTLFYRQALRDLAAFLGCEPTEQAIVAARAAHPSGDHLRRLLADARVEAVLLDDGYPRTGAFSVDEMAALGGVRAGRIVRIERLVEDLIPVHASLVAMREALTGELEQARPGLVGVKSIVAYRTGLIIEPPAPCEAEAALAAVRAAWGGVPGRLAAKPLLDYFVCAAAEWAAHGLPLQLHTGFGDRDVDLRLANPLHLRPL